MKFLITIAAAALAASSFALTFNGSGFPLVDASTDIGVAYGDITVSGTGLTIGSVDSVTLTNFTHTWAGDLVAVLYNYESDTAVTLFSPPDGTGANFDGTYTFRVNPTLRPVDQALSGQASSYNLPSGAYALSDYGGGTAAGPRNDFTSFSGLALDGTWELEIGDFAAGDTGNLGSWSFNVTPQAVPEPTTMAALGLGAVAVLRRRRKA